jgi:uncharacterized protein
MPEGRVLQVWRWPVKSMAGERLRSTRVDARGAGGDRTHAVLYEHKGEWKPLTAREAPRLLAWHATRSRPTPACIPRTRRTRS